MYDKYLYLFLCIPYDYMYPKFRGRNFLKGKECKNPYFKKVNMILFLWDHFEISQNFEAKIETILG